MMKQLLTILLSVYALAAVSQYNNLLRTDGVYIYDNGLDTIIEANDFARALADQYNESHHIKLKTNPCGQHSLVTMDGSTFLSMLAFFQSNTGRRSNLGACRSENHLRDNALLSLQREVSGDTTVVAINQQLHDIELFEDSTLRFYYSFDPYLQEVYVGKAYGDHLILEVRRTLRPESELFNGYRVYRFFSYAEIFNCDFIYSKP